VHCSRRLITCYSGFRCLHPRFSTTAVSPLHQTTSHITCHASIAHSIDAATTSSTLPANAPHAKTAAISSLLTMPILCCSDACVCRRFDRDLRRYVHIKENNADPNIGNDGLGVLLSALKSGPHRGMLLSDLIIPRCNIGKGGATLLANHLQHDFKNLQHLDIRENPGLGANFSLIAQSMQYCSLLTTLNLSACGLGAHGFCTP